MERLVEAEAVRDGGHLGGGEVITWVRRGEVRCAPGCCGWRGW